MGTQCEELAIMIALHATYDRDVGHPDMSHTGFPNDEGLDIGEEEGECVLRVGDAWYSICRSTGTTTVREWET